AERRYIHADIDIGNSEPPSGPLEVVALLVSIDAAENDVRVLQERVRFLPFPLREENLGPRPNAEDGPQDDLDLRGVSVDVGLRGSNQPVEVARLDAWGVNEPVMPDAKVRQLLGYVRAAAATADDGNPSGRERGLSGWAKEALAREVAVVGHA